MESPLHPGAGAGFPPNFDLGIPPPYEAPPKWIPPEQRPYDRNYNSDIQMFLPRVVVLKRLKASDALGFNIRGGKEHNFGFYVSKVMPGSEAARLGLKEGDQILRVNDIECSTLDHATAVRVLKFSTTIEMLVRFFPFGYQRTYDRMEQHNQPSSPSMGHR